MNPEERKPVHWCSLHGEEPCEMAENAKSAWQDYAGRARSTEVLRVMLSQDRRDPKHAAAYSENEAVEELQRDVRKSVAAAKARATRKAKAK